MGSVERKIEGLAELDAHALRAEWRQHYRAAPPRWLSRDLMVRGIAYKIQVRAHGGLSRTTQTKLRSPAHKLETEGHTGCNGGPSLKPGVKLVREWHGDAHTVLVRDDGFEYRGERYGSLSHIAREITSARWSGPRFFGLTKMPKPSPTVSVSSNG